MAYDANDPADKKIVKKLIDDALAAQTEEHEADISGLKAKNKELLGKIAKARSENGPDTAAELERLESELATTKKDLTAANRSLKKIETERDEFRTTAETATRTAHNLLVDGGLTEALVANNVAKQFMPAAKALLNGKAKVELEGDKHVAKIDGKPLSEFVKSWSQSDEGKVYVSAPANGGGNSLGGKATGGTGDKKIIPYADYNANPAAFAQELREGKATLGPQNAAA